MKLLVLWDVDHTLIETRGVGGEVFAAAFEVATGQALESMPDPTGRTEQDIFRRAAEAQHASGDYLFERFAQAQTELYRSRAGELRERGRVLPGVPGVLEALHRLPDVAQSVLSGNTRASARAKLDAFDLTRYLDLEASAGGDDDPVRANLVPIAQQRAAARYGVVITGADTVLIGDTPSDVETAHANGCRVVAVASGKTSAHELRDAGADHVLDDLTDVHAVLDVLGI